MTDFNKIPKIICFSRLQMASIPILWVFPHKESSFMLFKPFNEFLSIMVSYDGDVSPIRTEFLNSSFHAKTSLNGCKIAGHI